MKRSEFENRKLCRRAIRAWFKDKYPSELEGIPFVFKVLGPYYPQYRIMTAPINGWMEQMIIFNEEEVKEKCSVEYIDNKRYEIEKRVSYNPRQGLSHMFFRAVPKEG